MEAIKGLAHSQFQPPLTEGFCEINSSRQFLGQQFKSEDSFFCSNVIQTYIHRRSSQVKERSLEALCEKMPTSMLDFANSTRKRCMQSAIHDKPVYKSVLCSSFNENGSIATSYKSLNKSISAADVKERIDERIPTVPRQGLLTVENDEPADMLADSFHHGNGGVWTPDLQKHGSAPLQKLQHDNGNALENQVDSKNKGMQVDKGIGIVEFLKNKRILITGSTGFLAKVLVEKILREQPDVGQLYLLINANTTEKAKERLNSEVQGSKLFQLIEDKYGKQFKNFMQSKLTAVAGNVSRDGLGLGKEVAVELANKIDIIVNSAATTTFDERYDVAVDINTRGPLRLLEFGKKCPHLQLFLHLSTAFVNGQRRGCVPEKPLKMGESIAKELSGDHAAPGVDVLAEIALAQKALNGVNTETVVAQTAYMKRLGVQRAKLHGWQDTYVFTKAMGEMLIEESRAQIPVVILRPSVIESTIAEPFSGWMEGLRMMDPILIAYGKGQINGFTADPQGVLDVVPADMVVNATLAAMAKHIRQPGLRVYQIGSSVVNPLVFERIAKLLYQHFRSQPFMDQKGKPIIMPKLRLFKNKDSLYIYNFLKTEFPRQMAKFFPWLKSNVSEKRLAYLNQAAQQVQYLVDIYTPYTFYEGRFDISNTENLHQELSSEEKAKFGFEVRSIDWDNYIEHIHFPGLRKYPLKGRNIATRF
ncbi:hypothetical protein O6H91_08G009800 [Diphasiastrum complanatum]|uniref:Uncharacterized protein n=6 Tax=Diphasiastrum complanatum TaxID=34168 RepID=A0ACC2CUT3_DIPCM|nr:hypothetical protein O6H91_08G009800 [Diphasiastrum complanatum]KAJ7545777.1 hypothetical protein O6H91_08G009800 [Diphasiastrum complanatum]